MRGGLLSWVRERQVGLGMEGSRVSRASLGCPAPPRFWGALLAVPWEIVIGLPHVYPALTVHQDIPLGLRQPCGCAERITTPFTGGESRWREGAAICDFRLSALWKLQLFPC